MDQVQLSLLNETLVVLSVVFTLLRQPEMTLSLGKMFPF